MSQGASIGRRLDALRTKSIRFIVDSTSLSTLTNSILPPYGLLYYIKQRSQAFRGQAIDTNWKRGYKLGYCRVKPSRSEYQLTVDWINKVAKYAAIRSPNSTIIAARPKVGGRTYHGPVFAYEVNHFVKYAASRECLRSLQWSLQYFPPEVDANGEDLVEKFKDFTKIYNAWASSEGQQTFVDKVSSEEWDRVWSEGDVYE
jgi:hypothetical protein